MYVEGKLRTRKYDDANGVTKYITEILALNLNPIGGKSESSPQQNLTSDSTSSTASLVNFAPPAAQTNDFNSGADDDLLF